MKPFLDAGGFDPHEAKGSLTLPADWYYDPRVYALEREAIFYRSWWYLCHQSDLAEPGDFHCGRLGDQSVFAIRGDDGALRAFYNVCSHRAHPLLEGEGRRHLIVCPYHQWSYRNDGAFRQAGGRAALKDWHPAKADLKPVRLEIYGGFVFVNLDPEAAPLAEQAPQFLQDLYATCPRLDDLVRVERREREVKANWKTIVDNNHECYHCDANHKSLMELVDYDNKADWRDDGITFSHGVERKELDNSAYRLSAEDSTQVSLFGYIWPNLVPLFFPGSPSAVMFQILPTGPESAVMRHDFYFLSRDISDQEAAFMNWVSETLVPEDLRLCEAVQSGLHSRGYHQGPFAVDRDHVEFSEHHVHFFQAMVYRALMAAVPSGSLAK